MLVTNNTFGAALERISRCRPLTVDLETTGLRVWHGDKIAGVAVEADGAAYYFPFRHGEGLNLDRPRWSTLLNELHHGDHKLLGHNLIRFDAQHLMQETGNLNLCMPGGPPMEDTMIDALLMNENEETFGLKPLLKKYVPTFHHREDALLEELARRGYKGKEAKGNLWRLPPELVEPYACDDVIGARELHSFYVPHLDRWHILDLATEMYDYARLLSRLERSGFRVNIYRVERNIEWTKLKQAELLYAISRAAGKAINPNSSKQVCAWLGLPDSREETLLRCGHPDARLLIDYRKCTKVIGTYYKPILELTDANGILHPQLNLTRDPRDRGGTRTGRLSCSNPNFQALPQNDEIYRVRECLIPSVPGRKFGEFDYERAEVWMAGSYCGDEAIRRAYHEDRDLYAEMSAEIGYPRKACKIGFLMIQYGAGGWRVAQQFGWTKAQGDEFKRAFFAKYPKIKQAMYDCADQAERTKRLRLWSGRWRHFDGTKSKFYSAWNGLIQGAVGEMVRTAMQRLEGVLDGYQAQMKLQIHDSLVIEYPAANEGAVMLGTKQIMEDFDRFALRPRVDAKTGWTFGDMEKFDLEALSMPRAA